MPVEALSDCRLTYSPQETTLPLKLEKAKEAFYADLDQYARDEAGSQLCNQSRAPFEATIECTPAEINIPKKFILTTIDAAYPREVQEEMAKKWGATILGGIESGHSPWVKKENLAKLVELVVQEAAEY